MFIFITSAFAQGGQKFSTVGNPLSYGDFFGSINNMPIDIKVNNALAVTIKTNGDMQVYRFSGTGSGLVFYNNSGILTPFAFSGNPGYVLLGNGTWGETPLPDNFWKLDSATNNLYTLTPGYVGIGTSTPNYKLHVIGAAGISGLLHMGNNLTLNGDVPEITSGTGSLSFGNTNLSTAGKFKAGGITADGPGFFKDITVQNNLNISGHIQFSNLQPTINSPGQLIIQSQLSSGNTILNLLNGNVGIGITLPTMKLDVNGDACVRGYLYVNNGVIIGKKIESKSVDSDTLKVNMEAKIGTQLILDGNNSQIYSVGGIVDFRNSNLTTTGKVTASQIETDVFHSDTISFSEINSTGNIITTGDIYAKHIFAEKSVSIGNFTFKNGGSVVNPIVKDTIKTPYPIAIVSEANSIRMVADTVIMKDKLAIGKELAEYSLDVAGDARFQDMLIVEDGLIIGKDYRGETGEIDSLRSKDARIDTIRTDKLKAVEINATGKIDIGSGNTILIDGTGSKITSTTGLIDFGGTGLKTTGTLNVGAITAQQMSVDSTTFDELVVTRKIKVGSNSLILENDPGGNYNSIYTQGIAQYEHLYIQSTDDDNNTIINGLNNHGKVGIGVGETYFEDHEINEKVTIRGNLLIEGDEGFDSESEEAYIYFGDHNHYIKSVHGGTSEQGGLRIGTLGAENGITFFQFNGNVGIGTDNPQKKLHVMEISQGGSIEPPIEKGGSIRLEHICTGGTSSVWDIEPVVNTSPNLVPKFQIGTPGTPVLTLTSLGRVGIGTTDPAERLHVYDPQWPVWMKVENNSGYVNIGFNGSHGSINSGSSNTGVDADLYLNWYSGNDVVVGGGGIGPDNGGGPQWTLPETGNLYAKYSAYFATESGNVGIGTNNPQEKLHIYGKSNSSTNGTPVGLRIEQYNIPTNTSKYWDLLVHHENFYITNTITGPAALVITENGDVGIGTPLINNPHDYKLAVNGYIGAKEVFVETTSATWPDYVFDNNYRLQPLNELDSLLKLYKHLPDIPSADEIDVHGIALGDMNTALLKKIEEITLYLIEHDKLIERQQKTIQELKEKTQALELRINQK